MSYNEFEFEKDIEIDVDAEIELEFEVENEYESEVDVDYDICSDIDIDGNSALLEANVEAVGDDTLVEVKAVVLTTDHYSGVTVSGLSAVD